MEPQKSKNAQPRPRINHELIIGLEKLVRKRRDIDADIASMIQRHMDSGGSTWADVAQGLGVTRQAAQQRYQRLANPDRGMGQWDARYRSNSS